jgi:hypothetical protein
MGSEMDQAEKRTSNSTAFLDYISQEKLEKLSSISLYDPFQENGDYERFYRARLIG